MISENARIAVAIIRYISLYLGIIQKLLANFIIFPNIFTINSYYLLLITAIGENINIELIGMIFYSYVNKKERLYIYI